MIRLALSCLVLLIAPLVHAAETVLVAGASGRMGGYMIEQLADAGYAVRGLTRNPGKARARFGDRYEWRAADVRNPKQIRDAMQGVDYVISSIGAMEGGGPNGPEFLDYGGVRNLVDAAVEHQVKQFVLVSSIGAGQRFHLINITIDNVLTWKRRGEDHLRQSGLNYTVVRPGGLRAGEGGAGVKFFPGDIKGGSFIWIPDAAAVTVAAIDNPDAYSKTFVILTDTASSPRDWRSAYAALPAD